MHNICSTYLNKLFTGKKIFKIKGQKSPKLAQNFRILFSGPGELLGKSPPGKSMPRHVFIIEDSILRKIFKTIALKLTEEVRGQEGLLKSH